MTRKADIGEALDRLATDVEQLVFDLVKAYRESDHVSILAEDLMKQALDTPRRAKAQILDWISRFDARDGKADGAGLLFLAECLNAAGSTKTIASINAEITALENRTRTLVTNRTRTTDPWTWEQVADAIDGNFSKEPEEVFDFRSLPVPKGYVTVWGEPW